jgi:TonB-linked SusC/RagA family outer membrane protein
MKMGKVLRSAFFLSRSFSFSGGCKRIGILVSVMTLGLCAISQVKISGTVTDSSSGTPLANVSITWGAERGSITDNNGQYRITVPFNSRLTFQHVGYNPFTVIAGAETVIDVSLSESQQDLDQVVVVAYGSQRKATITGAISSIQTKEVKQSPAANLAVSLAGRLPGLTSIQRSGEPGNDLTQLFIRGQGTINAQSPIVLVDGVERSLTYIDPNEVESVTILKDASSTAIFGVRGANGVILITTRRGTSQIPEINFSVETAAQDFTRYITPVNSYEYATLRNLAQENDGLGDAYSAEALEHYKTQDDPVRYPNTDWRNILLKPYSFQQHYNLNVSGAGKAVRYFINAGYLDQGGQFKIEKNLPYDPSFNLRRYNFRSNIDVQLSKSLKAYLNIGGYLENRNMPYGLSWDGLGNDPSLYILAYMYNLNATIPGPLTPSGQVMTTSLMNYPAYGQLNRTGYIQQTKNNITATYGMEQSLDFLTKGLSAKAVMSFDSYATNNLNASRGYEHWEEVVDPVLKGVDGKDSVYYRMTINEQNTPLSITGTRSFNSLSNLQAYLNYHRTFNKHTVTGLLLYQRQKQVIEAQLPFNLMGIASRLTYGFDNRYFLEFNAGYNGSEQFAKGRRFGFFPAVSGAWIISKEKFLENNKIITLLKLRGSYGSVGNDRIGNRRFLYLDDIQVVGGGLASLAFGQAIQTNLLKNDKLQWEVSKKTDIGLEVGLLNDFNLVIDVFKERRDNILMNQGTVPLLSGLSANVLPPLNVGIVENKGYEIELNYRKAINKDLSVLSKLNVSYARNRQIYSDEVKLPAEYAYPYRQTGYRIGQPFVYIVEGYFADDADVAKSPVQNVGGHPSRPGDFKYKDVNKDGVVNELDLSPVGYSTVPEYSFGAAFNVNYKNFDVSVLFQGVTHINNFYQGRGTFTRDYYVTRHLESWTPERAASGERISYPRLTTQPNPNEINNTFFNIDASYLRLKNVEIGYRFQINKLKSIGLKSLRLYANGFNLLTWDRLPTKNFDPELLDDVTYPITRLYNVGVNLSF